MIQSQAVRDRIEQIANAGFYLALRVGFSFPEDELNNLPDPWIEHYTSHGLVVVDPAMQWVYSRTGSVRMSDLRLPDPREVVARASGFGLNFGAAISVMGPQDHGRRSYGLFFRRDREFLPAELLTLEDLLGQLHAGSGENKSLTSAEIEALKLQSGGLRLKEVAMALGISESAVKARLNNAKRKLAAKTLAQAVSIAAARRLI